MITAKKRELRKECYPDIAVDKEYEVVKATMTYLMFKGNPRHYRSTVFHLYIDGVPVTAAEAKEHLKREMVEMICREFKREK